MLDQTDRAILDLLRANSRLTWKEIGRQVHLTGQAVAARIARLEEEGVLQGFTVRLDEAMLGRPLLAFVTVFMTTTNHAAFQLFLAGEKAVCEAHRISGEGCYQLRVQVADHAELSGLLDRILPYGNYRVNLSIGPVK